MQVKTSNSIDWEKYKNEEGYLDLPESMTKKMERMHLDFPKVSKELQ